LKQAAEVCPKGLDQIRPPDSEAHFFLNPKSFNTLVFPKAVREP
jgi:hypothetical protein